MQTACSTSLVAVHLACQSLLARRVRHGAGRRRLDQRAAAAPATSTRRGASSRPTATAAPSTPRAQGTVVGNGVGVVVLKRLADALADGDTIHAVIQGSAINNDGSVKVGYTAPSVEGQAAVIAEALAVAGVDAGDDRLRRGPRHRHAARRSDRGRGADPGVPRRAPTRTRLLRPRLGQDQHRPPGRRGRRRRADQDRRWRCEHGEIPPSLHFERAQPARSTSPASPFYVNDRAHAPGRRDGAPRRAGVSSFGIGGTNAHVVLEEAPARRARPARPGPAQLLVLSARTRDGAGGGDGPPGAAPAASIRTCRWPTSPTPSRPGRKAFAPPADAWSAATPRRPRRCWRRRDPQRVLTRVAGGRGPARSSSCSPARARSTPDMGRDLYRTEPVFREELDRCLPSSSQPHLGARPARAVSSPRPRSGGGRAAASSGRRSPSRPCSPSSTPWPGCGCRWGVRPQAMIGHSLGEYVAACLAGVLSLADALALVAARGRLIRDACPRAPCSPCRCPRRRSWRCCWVGATSRSPRSTARPSAWSPVRPRRSRGLARRSPERGVERPPPAHRHRLPLADDGARSCAEFGDFVATLRAVAAAHPLHLQRHRHLDHRGRGDRSRLLGAPPAPDRALRRRRRRAAGRTASGSSWRSGRARP